jgi:hypothetical protein
MLRWLLIFRYSAFLILSITGLAKIVASYGGVGLLQFTDPITGLNFKHLIFITGVIELLVATICIFEKYTFSGICAVAWISANLCFYRIELWRLGWHKPCSCLGSLTEPLHISSEAADTAMKIILAYLLIGSYGSLFWLWRQRKKAAALV